MKLRECPFCRVIPWYGEFPSRDSDERHEIACENPDCPVRVEVYANSKEAALAKWNTRAVDPLIVQLGEALSRIIAELPHNKDWLDPVLESQAREAVSQYQEVKP